MLRPRDSQKSRLYAAENEAFPDHAHTDPTLREVAQLQAWVDALLKKAWFIRRWGHRWINVTHNGGKRGSRAVGKHTIRMSTYHRNRYVTLHEVAHCLTYSHHASHGPEYARTLLELVRYTFGPEDAKRLREKFREHRVRVAPRRAKLTGFGVVEKRTKRRGNPVALARWRAQQKAQAGRGLDVALAIANTV